MFDSILVRKRKEERVKEWRERERETETMQTCTRKWEDTPDLTHPSWGSVDTIFSLGASGLYLNFLIFPPSKHAFAV